jgi:hypothetical protein
MLSSSHKVELGVENTRGDGGAAAALAAEFKGALFTATGGSSSGVGGGPSNGVPSLTTARQLLTKFAFPANRYNT